MGKSSFHIGDEFNGKGEKVYLKAGNHNVFEPPKRQRAKPTPQFTNVVQKAAGVIPAVNLPSENSSLLAKATGAVASVGRVAVTKDEKKGEYVVSFKVSKEQLTTGSYLHKSGAKAGQ